MKGARKRRNRTAGVFAGLRFLGAFRKSPVGVWDSLKWECSSECPERACVALREGRAFEALKGVAVLFASNSIRRVFNGDCWSELKDNGELHPTRNYKGDNANGFWSYEEAFVKAGETAVAIVVNNDKIVNNNIASNIEDFATKLGLPVVSCNEKAIKAFLKERRHAKW